MMNVLPESAVRALSREYIARSIVALSGLLMIAAGVGFLTLLPSYVALQVNLGAHTDQGGHAHDVTAQDRADIVRTQKLIGQLHGVVNATSSPSATIRVALGLRPKGVIVEHMTYAPGLSGSLVLVGTAPSREGISSYRDALAHDPHFKTVSLPVDALVGAQGGQFTITLSGAF